MAAKPTQQEISTKAYLLWEAEGRQPGKDAEYWARAEALLSKADAPAKKEKTGAPKKVAPKKSAAKKEAPPLKTSPSAGKKAKSPAKKSTPKMKAGAVKKKPGSK